MSYVVYNEELWNAASVGDLDTVKILLNPENIEGGNPDEEGETSLFTACEFGHLEVVKYLVEQGANIEALRGTGSTPLFVASSNGRFPVVKYLLEKGANVNHEKIHKTDHRGTPLFLAAQEGHTEVARILLEYGASPNWCRLDGCSSLYKSSEGGHVGIVQLLLQHGANIHQRDTYGKTACWVSERLHEKQVEIVLKDWFYREEVNKIWSKEAKWLWAGHRNGDLNVLPKDLIKVISRFLFDEARSAVLQ